MKRCLIVMAAMLLFVQCKEGKMETDNEVRKLPVSIDIPISETRSYFGDIIDSGKISWWNSHNQEYFYLAIGYNSVDENNVPFTKGVLAELRVDLFEATDVISCKGYLPDNYLMAGRTYVLYYFGNNGNAMENTNVTNIYDDETGDVIGKTVHFNTQNGDWRNLGDYHIASVTVRAVEEKDDEGTIIGYRLVPQGQLDNKMSIAVLDLSDVNMLKGSATYNSVYEVRWNGYVFEENIYTDDRGFDVGHNVGDKSFVVLLPNDNRVSLECSKGIYIFENGIAPNNIYIGGGETMDDVRPLAWRKQ